MAQIINASIDLSKMDINGLFTLGETSLTAITFNTNNTQLITPNFNNLNAYNAILDLTGFKSLNNPNIFNNPLITGVTFNSAPTVLTSTDIRIYNNPKITSLD